MSGEGGRGGGREGGREGGKRGDREGGMEGEGGINTFVFLQASDGPQEIEES